MGDKVWYVILLYNMYDYIETNRIIYNLSCMHTFFLIFSFEIGKPMERSVCLLKFQFFNIQNARSSDTIAICTGLVFHLLSSFSFFFNKNCIRFKNQMLETNILKIYYCLLLSKQFESFCLIHLSYKSFSVTKIENRFKILTVAVVLFLYRYRYMGPASTVHLDM